MIAPKTKNESAIERNYHAVRRVVASACEKVGRKAQDVKIVAVSKTVGEPEILEAIAAGIVNFGENRTALFKERAAA
ncbi:MAG: hypothetical protein LBB42_04780, partial [Coriobacteriales bacterium]|nr:hypothetical protein [Coriobacteriales bacterium]